MNCVPARPTMSRDVATTPGLLELADRLDTRLVQCRHDPQSSVPLRMTLATEK
jgi:hypothetical protein